MWAAPTQGAWACEGCAWAGSFPAATGAGAAKRAEDCKAVPWEAEGAVEAANVAKPEVEEGAVVTPVVGDEEAGRVEEEAEVTTPPSPWAWSEAEPGALAWASTKTLRPLAADDDGGGDGGTASSGHLLLQVVHRAPQFGSRIHRLHLRLHRPLSEDEDEDEDDREEDHEDVRARVLQDAHALDPFAGTGGQRLRLQQRLPQPLSSKHPQ